MVRTIFFIVLSGLVLQKANASVVKLGVPLTSRCNETAVTAQLDSDGSINFQFDRFQTEAGRITGVRVDRMSCSFSIPIEVPAGYAIALTQVAYRGHSQLPLGGATRIETDFQWGNQAPGNLHREFLGPMDNAINVRANLQATNEEWSACGATVNLKVNTTLTVSSNQRMDKALALIDSAQASSGLIYHLKSKKCDSVAVASSF